MRTSCSRLLGRVGLGLTLAAISIACGADSAVVDSSVDGGSGADASRPDGGAGADAAADSATTTDSASTSDGPATTCGTCPPGYTCGTANGLPVCRAASGIPLFTNVFVIVMENTSKSTLDAATNTPWLTALKKSGATAADYHGVDHPSLPNYIALMSGDTQGIGCDCAPTGSACNGVTCNRVLGNCGCSKPAAHFGDQLETAGKTWKAYGEDMGTACNTTSAGKYAARHVPFLYFDNVGTAAARCAAHVVDYGAFKTDLAATPPAFAFIAPNLTSDMHDPFPSGAGNLANGDTWLSTNAQAILDSAAFKAGGLLVIVWDEDDNSGIPNADAPIPMFVLSPYAKKGGYESATKADHYALLATLEDGLGIATHLGKAAQATPLADYFPAN